MTIPNVFRFLRASALWEYDQFPVYSEHSDRNEFWFPKDELPALALFVSHRWEREDHPDPISRQLNALRKLIEYLGDVVAAARLERQKRCDLVPSPYKYGVLQAFSILGAAYGSETDLNNDVWHNWIRKRKSLKDLPASELLEHVGFWYDYSCMPQSDTDKAKSDNHSDQVKEALSQLAKLVETCPILILRWPNDLYDGRGWCAAELSIGRSVNRHIVLRTDLMGTMIDRQDVFAPTDPFKNRTGTEGLINLLDRWMSQDKELHEADLFRIHFEYSWELEQMESASALPCYVTRAKPEIFPGLRQLLIFLIEKLDAISQLDRRNQSTKLADIEQIVRAAMGKAGLSCKKSDDVVFVGLMILEARHAVAIEMAAFYRECILRWLNGRTLKLARYREERERNVVRVWYLFVDEEPNVRPKPYWVKKYRWPFSLLQGLWKTTYKQINKD